MTSFENKCLAAGLKVTKDNNPILDSLLSFEEHPSVEDIYERAKKDLPSLKIEKVYRFIDQLHEADLVKKHEFQEGYARFEAVTETHNLMDLDTGDVIECDPQDLESLKAKS